MKKKVLVTGGAGFIAHHVIEAILHRTDWDIVTLDRLDFSGSLNRLHEMMMDKDEATRRRVRIIFHDLRAEINTLTANNIGDCNYVLHLAAGSHVDRAIIDPLEFVQDNVIGTCNILNYARQCKNLERFIYFSTDEIFGPAPIGVSYGERDRYNSTNPYSATKAAGEELAVAFHNTYDLPVYVCHTTNVFGTRQHPEKYIPKCIKNIRDGNQITVHADATGKPGSRNYVHASDVADALLFIIGLDGNFEVDYGSARCPKFNIVGSEEIDNLSIAQMVADIMQRPLDYQMLRYNDSRPNHDVRYSLKGDYLESLGWKPKLHLKDELSKVVRWTLDNDQWLLA